MLSAHSGNSFGNEALLRELPDVVAVIRAAAKRRHYYMHALWTISDDYPDHIIRSDIMVQSSLDPIGAEQLEADIDVILAARDKLSAYLGRVFRALENL